MIIIDSIYLTHSMNTVQHTPMLIVLCCVLFSLCETAVHSQEFKNFVKELKECPVDPPYVLIPTEYGAEIKGFNLTQDLYEGLADRIKVFFFSSILL